MCDHKWGDGPDEYEKTRTIANFIDEGQLYELLRCDMCKKFVIKSVQVVTAEEQ